MRSILCTLLVIPALSFAAGANPKTDVDANEYQPSFANSTSIIEGWPDLLVCRSGSAYEILYNRVRGNGQNVAYTNGTTFVRFEGSSKRIHKVDADTAAVKQSACKLRAHISQLETYNLPKGGPSLIPSWPDAIVCHAGNNKYEILYNRVRGSRGYVAYQNHGAFVRFNDITREVETVEGDTAAIKESDCYLGNSINNIQNFNIRKKDGNTSPISIAGNYPDMMVCRSPQGKYEILYHWIRGLGGNTAYSNPGSFVRFEKQTGKIHKVNGTTKALKESSCYTEALTISEAETYSFNFPLN